MQLREWRKSRNPRWTLERIAQALTDLLGEEVQARTIHRYEIGQTQITTRMAEAIKVLTDEAVLPTDFHQVRVQRLIESGQLRPIERSRVA